MFRKLINKLIKGGGKLGELKIKLKEMDAQQQMLQEDDERVMLQSESSQPTLGSQ